MKFVLALHLHQPWRLGRFRYLDLGSRRPYVDVERNLTIFRGVAERSYRPALTRLVQIAERYPEFRWVASVSGPFVEQARLAAPDVLQLLSLLAARGQVEFLSETFDHSLSFLLPPLALDEEVQRHRSMLRETFAAEPVAIRMTELAYSDELAVFASRRGYPLMLAEGWEPNLAGRTPNQLYAANGAPLKVLTRNYRLSDDIAFRFGQREWNEYPLTSDKFARWVAGSPGEVVGVFVDFETFGEHQPVSGGILDFLAGLPRSFRRHPGLEWASLASLAEAPAPSEVFAAPDVVTWADSGRDLNAWLGNDLQRSAFEAAKKLDLIVRATGDRELLEAFRPMLTSDHFYYMYLGTQGGDAAVHRYFSSYTNPYDAYANYMNVLTDLRRRADALTRRGRAG